MPYGSRQPYAATPRNELAMRQGVRRDEKFANPSPNSVDWAHRKLAKIQKGNEGNFARSYRMAQEDLLTARLDEERQIQQLTQGRRPQLIGEAGRARAAHRAAEQVFAQ